MTSHSEQAKAVLKAEAAGLEETAALIDDGFAEAVNLVLNTEGYLIVTGVGKSGHIGAKLAASFASTGTPSFFLHPTEASHGDLGMVRRNSCVLAISNSGESRELVDVLSYCRKNAVPVIGITKNPGSTLGRFSTVVLRLPETPEVCVNNLAPTTSTTNTLGLGDALVVTVMNEKGVTREDFGRHHPGGKLGRRLQTVDDWLSTRPHDVPVVTGGTGMADVITAISAGQNGCVAVTDPDGLFIGMVTDGDLRRTMDQDFFSRTAADIMTADPVSVSPQTLMSEVVSLLNGRNISNTFVVDAGRPVGVIHINSLLRDGYV